MYNTSDLRKGLKIEIEGQPYVITDFQFVKPGKGQALYRCKLKNILNGTTLDKTYRSTEKIGKPDLMQKDMSYSYPEGDHFVFMDDETYEQVTVDKDVIGDLQYFLLEDMPCKVLFFNDIPIDVELPVFVEKQITHTEPGARGDTATNVSKPAQIDNGYEIHVPLFVNEGDWVKIDTRTGEYSERVNRK
jgi:elongation factor P